ncbi:MAG: PorV/PorQ family protein [Bacteroidetes bacterium]|nr:PorV/PorQ family protein [Bacteroidota bacterium]MBU1486315.1 PorV/PorQ family protein [Bacteroidota bacterium]MBU2046732.1 PorV/PorQ family protein [Bacteroidota bacterium]MBU2269273.1 PorV/PorQ family protein [Bacteroidota bacterium]MBU2376049.1 PorV/PorQ family protein [Bacteroidota bacterium]
MIKRSLFLLIFSLPMFLFAQKRKYSNEFLQIGVGSRAFGMAGSVVSSISDVTSGYWNPAGLINMKSNTQFSLMHSEYFAGIAKYDYAGFATFVADKTAVISASLIRFGVDDIPDTSELIDADGNINYDRVKSFSSADYAFLFSYARNQKKRKEGENGLSYGANVKIIHRKIGDYGKSWGFGLDIGAQYQLNHFKFAAVGRDITTTFNAWSYNPDKFSSIYTATGNDIPKNTTETTLPRIILGTAYEAKLSQNFGLTTELDFNLTTDGKRNVLVSAAPVSIDPTVGFEADYKKIVFLRTGIGNIQKTTNFDGSQQYSLQPNLGLGIKIKKFSIDYALTDIGNQSDGLYSNVFSIRIDFDKGK